MQTLLLSIPLLASAVTAAGSCNANASSVDLAWHPPNSTSINSLSAVINGTGIDGFIFNSSSLPAGVPYGTYDWCNMPHVRRQEYPVPSDDYKLEYVEVIHRHHKRTPYASNTFPHETYSWSCDDAELFYYAAPTSDPGSSAQVNWHVYTSPSNPFAPAGFNGSCQFPQITLGGLQDSHQHGADLFAVYHDLLAFLPSQFDASKVSYRVTNNVITSQVASQLIPGMYPATADAPFTVLIQPDSIDSLEPTYTCANASSLFSSYGVGSSAANWTLHLNLSAPLFAELDSVSGVNPSDSGWHNWFDHYFDNLSARLCHSKPLPCAANDSSHCITEAEADTVFRTGEYEYSFIYRDSPSSLPASTASYGAWIAELAAHFRTTVSGTGNGTIYRHNVAHDGSMSRLLSILQVDVMIWPGMGSELVFELYSNSNPGSGCGWSVRVLWGGKVLRSSNPSLGLMDMVPLETVLAYFDGLVGVGAALVPGLCGS